MTELTHKKLLELLHYDPETGLFTWLVSRGNVRSGRNAGYLSPDQSKMGVWKIRVLGIKYRRAALAWFYMTGVIPVEIDHRDVDSTNDRWKNLREATRSQNLANRRIYKNNRSGFKGVKRSLNRWSARIGKLHLGSFDTPEEANAAYESAAKKAFGEFARAA